MALSLDQRAQLIMFVQQEPCTVQDVATQLGVSWVTAERYVKQVEQETGEVRMKVFREGTRGALKLVYHATSESVAKDEIEKELYKRIRAGRFKHHFDFMDVYQHVPENKKSARLHKHNELHGVTSLIRTAQEHVLIFSGNLSLVHTSDDQGRVLDALTQALERGVHIKILCRVNPATVSNLSGLRELFTKYSSQLQVRHAYTPLRGILVDNARARFKDIHDPEIYRSGELEKTLTVFYEVQDIQWVSWLARVFFNVWRSSGDGLARKQEFGKLLE